MQLKLFKTNFIDRPIVRQRGDFTYPCSLRSMHLNKWKPNHHAHHIDEYHVVFIPKEMHESVRHSLVDGTNMDIINDLAMKYFNSTFKGDELNAPQGRLF